MFLSILFFYLKSKWKFNFFFFWIFFGFEYICPNNYREQIWRLRKVNSKKGIEVLLLTFFILQKTKNTRRENDKVNYLTFSVTLSSSTSVSSSSLLTSSAPVPVTTL